MSKSTKLNDKSQSLLIERAGFKKALIKAQYVASTQKIYLLEAGVSLRQIQMWMGHSSITMTAHYAQLTTQSMEVSGKLLGALMSELGKLPG